MSDGNIELNKSIVDIMKDLPDSGNLHPSVFEKEVSLRKNHADIWLDKIPWFNQYSYWRTIASEAIMRSINLDSSALDKDMEIMNLFEDYKPDFEDTLI